MAHLRFSIEQHDNKNVAETPPEYTVKPASRGHNFCNLYMATQMTCDLKSEVAFVIKYHNFYHQVTLKQKVTPITSLVWI